MNNHQGFIADNETLPDRTGLDFSVVTSTANVIRRVSVCMCVCVQFVLLLSFFLKFGIGSFFVTVRGGSLCFYYRIIGRVLS